VSAATGAPTRVVLEVSDLNIWLPGPVGPLEVVEHADLRLSSGEVLGIAGESGSGKTITALSLLGLLPSGGRANGSIRLDGKELLALRREEWKDVRGVGISMVFQDPMTSLHPMLSIGTQLSEHYIEHGLGSRQQARARALELLDRVRIPNPRAAIDSYPHQLSGGMRQRVAIAMALACSPKVLIADEPTTALDVTVQAGILHLLKSLCTDDGMAMILVTHDLGVMSSVADRLAIFYAGRVVEQGPCRELLVAPRHPYTRGLLDALPGTHGDADDDGFRAIPGSPPQPGSRPEGCTFAPRCPHVVDACRVGRPMLQDIAPQRSLACGVDPFHRAAVVA